MHPGSTTKHRMAALANRKIAAALRLPGRPNARINRTGGANATRSRSAARPVKHLEKIEQTVLPSRIGSDRNERELTGPRRIGRPPGRVRLERGPTSILHR